MPDTRTLTSSGNRPRTGPARRQLPCELGRYVLFDHIGRGGMADLYLARSRTTYGDATRLVVIKEVIPELASDEHFATTLISEAKLAARLSHRNVVTVEDLGREGGVLYIAMEYVEGLDLRELLRSCTKRKIALPIVSSLFVHAEVLQALEYAHHFCDADGSETRVVHRDVSPSNVLLSFDGEVKLCDFGIAIAMTADRMTAEVIEGKAGYMSPEQARGEPIDPRSDIFAAGIILWELLSGRRLYKAAGGEPLLEVAKRAEIPPIKERGLPDEKRLHQIARRALARDPQERYQRAGEMRDELNEYRAGAKLTTSAIRFGEWLSEHFADERVQGRRSRERALAALELGPPVVIEPLPPSRPGASGPDPDAASAPSVDSRASGGRPSAPSKGPAASQRPSTKPAGRGPFLQHPLAVLFVYALVVGGVSFGILWLLTGGLGAP
ncbi:MAG: protein kinase [Deltaproteobacteria bacterium]|nr:protein kinase [Deltaproteobacteria bacterium]